MSGPVAVSELQAAWRAVQAGQFGPGTRPVQPDAAPTQPSGEHGGLDPKGDVVLVVGAHRGAGATTLALAICTAAGGPAHLVECAPTVGSGLVAAATAELGQVGPWCRGTRGPVVLDRLGGPAPRFDPPIPQSAPHGIGLTVLDPARDVAELLADQDWVAHRVRAAKAVVLATTATIPGVRRLEASIDQLAPRAVVAALLGPTRRRWPRPVASATGPLTRELATTGRLVTIPHCRALAVGGVTAACLPAGVVAAAGEVLEQIASAHQASVQPHGKELS